MVGTVAGTEAAGGTEAAVGTEAVGMEEAGITEGIPAS